MRAVSTFVSEITDYYRNDAERLIIDKLDLELEADDFELEPELPSQTRDWASAAYVVAVNMEEFRGYNNKEAAFFVRNIMRGVNEEFLGDSASVDVLYKLEEDEVEEAVESGWIDNACYELAPDEFWCLEES